MGCQSSVTRVCHNNYSLSTLYKPLNCGFSLESYTCSRMFLSGVTPHLYVPGITSTETKRITESLTYSPFKFILVFDFLLLITLQNKMGGGE